MIQKLDDVNMKYAFPEVAFGEDYIVGTFQLRIKTKNIEKLAMAICDEQSTGTWIKVSHDSLDKQKNFGCKLLSVYQVPDFGSDHVEDLPPMYVLQIGFPCKNVGASYPSMLSTVFGNISASGMLKWIDVAFPKSFVEQYQGPKFGVEGIRDLLDVHDRPLVNCMIKPNIGWTPEEGAEIFYEAAKGGVDLVKDDELMLADSAFCPLEKRVKLFMEKERKVYEETGEHTLYAVNITDNLDKLRDNALRALDCGVNALMVNTYTCGQAALKALADDPDINVPILAHVDYAGAYCSSTYTGINAPLIIGKLTRLCGGDLEIMGHPWGKFPVPFSTFSRTFRAFTLPWWNIKPMFDLVSGGTNQLMIDKAMDECGIDIVLAAGGGVHGHPDGSCAGAKSMRQAIDAAMEGIPVEEYAKDHVELRHMIQQLNPNILKNFDLMN